MLCDIADWIKKKKKKKLASNGYHGTFVPYVSLD